LTADGLGDVEERTERLWGEHRVTATPEDAGAPVTLGGNPTQQGSLADTSLARDEDEVAARTLPSIREPAAKGGELAGALEQSTGCSAWLGTERGHATGHVHPPPNAAKRPACARALEGRGVGKALLHRLADRARNEGITQFTALMLSDNRAMRRLLADLGTTRLLSSEPGAVELAVDLLGRRLDLLIAGQVRGCLLGAQTPVNSR